MAPADLLLCYVPMFSMMKLHNYVCWSFFSSSTESNEALEKQSSQPPDDPPVKEKSPEVEVRAFEFKLPNSFSW